MSLAPRSSPKAVDNCQDWPAAARPAIEATRAAVEQQLAGRWRAIMAMGSLGYGGYVADWSDCDIDVLLNEDETEGQKLAAALMQRLHAAGFPQVDVRCYRVSEINSGSAQFPLGCVNRAIMLKHSARVIAGQDVTDEIEQPSAEQVRREVERVLDHLCSYSDAWWTELPSDDIAAYIALPGRLLYTLRTGNVGGKLHGLRELFALAQTIDSPTTWSAILWSLSCRHEPLARTIPAALVQTMALEAAGLARVVRAQINRSVP